MADDHQHDSPIRFLAVYKVFIAVLVLSGVTRWTCLASGQVVYVHLVDAKTGSMIPARTLEMSWGKRSARHRRTERTGIDGRAAFHLDEPLPRFIEIALPTSERYWIDWCSPRYYVMEDVLRSGAYEETDYCSTKYPGILGRFHPKSGEIYYFVEHPSFGELVKQRFRALKGLK